MTHTSIQSPKKSDFKRHYLSTLIDDNCITPTQTLNNIQINHDTTCPITLKYIHANKFMDKVQKLNRIFKPQSVSLFEEKEIEIPNSKPPFIDNETAKQFGTLFESQSLKWFEKQILQNPLYQQLFQIQNDEDQDMEAKREHNDDSILLSLKQNSICRNKWMGFVDRDYHYTWILTGKIDAYIPKRKNAIVEIKNRVGVRVEEQTKTNSSINWRDYDVIQLLSYMCLFDSPTGYLVETKLGTSASNNISVFMSVLRLDFVSDAWNKWITPRLYTVLKAIIFLIKHPQYKQRYLNLSRHGRNLYLARILQQTGITEIEL